MYIMLVGIISLIIGIIIAILLYLYLIVVIKYYWYENCALYNFLSLISLPIIVKNNLADFNLYPYSYGMSHVHFSMTIIDKS